MCGDGPRLMMMAAVNCVLCSRWLFLSVVSYVACAVCCVMMVAMIIVLCGLCCVLCFVCCAMCSVLRDDGGCEPGRCPSR